MTFIEHPPGLLGPVGVRALREESVPSRLPQARTSGPLIAANQCEILLDVPGVGRFLVRASGQASVERTPGATDADLACFRDGPVAAAAALLRGDLVLRGASVSIDGRALVVCGSSAAGKSALAAALAQRGHAVLADAVTAISIESEQRVPIVTPVAPEPVLWPDTVRALALSKERGRSVRPSLPMRAFSVGPKPPRAASVAAVVILATDVRSDEPAFTPLSGAANVGALLAARWHGHLSAPLGREDGQFQIASRLANEATCVRLIRPRVGSTPSELAELVEGLAA